MPRGHFLATGNQLLDFKVNKMTGDSYSPILSFKKAYQFLFIGELGMFGFHYAVSLWNKCI